VGTTAACHNQLPNSAGIKEAVWLPEGFKVWLPEGFMEILLRTFEAIRKSHCL